MRWGPGPSPVRLRRARTLRIALLAMLAVFGASLLLTQEPGRPVGGVSGVLYVLTSLLAAFACWFPLSSGRVAVWGWRLVGVQSLLVVLAAALVATSRTGGDSSGYPPVSDWIVLLGRLLLYAAAVLLVTAQAQRLAVGAWLDGLVVALGIAAVANAVLLTPLNAATVTGPASPAILLGHPVADLGILLAVTATILNLRLAPSRGLQLLLVAVALRLAGDGVRLAMEVAGTHAPEALVAFLWLAAGTTAGIAAGFPTTTRALRGAPGVPPSVRWGTLVLPLGAAAAGLAILAVAQERPLPAAASNLAILTLALALARTALTFREVLGLADVHSQARTDDLTGLPNRRALYETADAIFERHAGSRSPHRSPRQADRPGDTVDGSTSLVIVDLDRFKEINDSLGHPTGDLVLVQVGARIATQLRDGDLLARLGGDEFALLLPRTAQTAALDVARAVRKSLEDSFTVDTMRMHIDASFGVATMPLSEGSRAELVRCADVAMYDAKRSGAGVALYDPLEHPLETSRVQLGEELRSTLAGDADAVGRLLIHLQPQIALTPDCPHAWRVHGMEALVRWEHPEHGLMAPARFLPLAASLGLMRPLGSVVGNLALDACARWWERGFLVPVSVNLSGTDMHDDALPERVRSALELRGLPASALVIEVTEHSLMADASRVGPVLDQLRASGVAISIDDYGTGFSSLAYLRTLPIDELKLDRLLVADVTRDPASASIVRHTVDLAHSLGLRVVAEGIEDVTTCTMLRQLGCDVGQGFHLARPMGVAEALVWLDQTAG